MASSNVGAEVTFVLTAVVSESKARGQMDACSRFEALKLTPAGCRHTERAGLVWGQQ